VNNSERLIAALSDAPGPVCDDCASVKTSVFPRQQINQIAGRLFAEGRIVRRSGTECCYCKAAKLVSSVGASPPIAQPAQSRIAAVPVASGRDATRAWHWEGNIQATLAEYLQSTGWTITNFANTSLKQTGIDLALTRSGKSLVVEVKGYPGTTYEHGAKRGRPKPTRPTSQATQWYSHALHSAMRLLETNPTAAVALCFPDFPKYRELIHATRSSLNTLRIGVYLVTKIGEVSEHVPVGR